MTSSLNKKVYIVKLTVGDMIVGLLKEVTPTDFIIDEPHFIVANQHGEMCLAKYLPLFKDKFLPFNKNSVDVHGEANMEIEHLYWKTTTGLEIPPKKHIITDF
jgi:hypothetical protein